LTWGTSGDDGRDSVSTMASAGTGLAAHDAAVARDLQLLNLPPSHWLEQRTGRDGESIADVVVVGAGMCGIAAATSLLFRGIRNIRILERSRPGSEGPWVTFARMETLRSPKHLSGPAMGIPSLTFRAWYEAIHGAAGWRRLDKIPNAVWMDYLAWLRRVLALPVENGIEVTRIEAAAGTVRLAVSGTQGDSTIVTRRLVLATGRGGAGGLHIPDFVDRALWPDLARHTAEDIDFRRFAGRRIAVIGGGASAWDNAATALEAGAARVDMYVRRPVLPQINKGRGSSHPGFFQGFAALSDAERWNLLVYLEDRPAPPPRETVLRTIRHPGFAIHLGTPVTAARRDGQRVKLGLGGATESHHADFLIVGTGFRVDLDFCPELAPLVTRIATWGDRHTPPDDLRRPKIARFPYLGRGFELAERSAGSCPDLARIHLFNYAANASLGAVSGDIPGVVFGAERLASFIAEAFFQEDLAHIRRELDAFAEPELQGTPFFAL
jgi:FAD-dependent urate hydroxylase